MKKQLIAGILLASVVLMGGATSVLAQGGAALPGASPVGTQPPITPPNVTQFQTVQGFINLLGLIANWVFAILIILVVFIILWAAFEFLTSGGDPEKTKSARNKLVWAAVGIVVAIIAFVFPSIVRSLIGVAG